MSDRASGPLAFVTGASSGIGQALAERFYAEGHRLALVGRRPAELQAWAAAKGWDPERVAAYGADARDVDAMVAAGLACIAAQGLPDAVVACAGISVGMDASERSDIDAMREVLETNNIGLAATFQPFVSPMRERGSGRLVGIASVAAIRGLPGHGAYCASKAGVVAFCESLRVELRGTGVGVVTICPGYIDTPLTRGNPYKMPFLMPVERFAHSAFRAIERGDSYRVVPWQMGVLAKLMRALPNWAYDGLLAGRARKPRRSAA